MGRRAPKLCRFPTSEPPDHPYHTITAPYYFNCIAMLYYWI